MTFFHQQCIDYFVNHAVQAHPQFADRRVFAEQLKQNYAQLKARPQVRNLTGAERAIYGVTRMAGTLSALEKVLSIFDEQGLIKPNSVLDCGSGPGTALFAAHAQFDAQRYTAIEKDAGFIEMAQTAVHQLMPGAASKFRFVHGEVPRVNLPEKNDLTIFSYVLSEIAAEQIDSLMQWAIEQTNHYLVIVDAGTPAVSAQIVRARTHLLRFGFRILAPCPHQLACPMTAPDFCHFPARFTRNLEAKRLKQGTAQSEDEKFSYLIAATPSLSPLVSLEHPRIIKRPIKRSGHCIFDLCTEKGAIERVILSKSDGENYTRGKKREWGDALQTPGS